MNKKSLAFIKDTPFFDSGIYDNKVAFENTKKAIDNLIKNKYGLVTHLKCTQDNEIICYKDDDLMRLLHVEDKIKHSTFDNISYIAKFPIMKLEELISIANCIPIIFEIDKGNIDYRLRIMNVLSSYEGSYAIISKDIDTLKWINKNYPNIIKGYKVDKTNLYRFHLFKKYDFMVCDINLYNDKQIKKLREEYLVLGNNVTSDQVYESMIGLYDNLICDSNLEK